MAAKTANLPHELDLLPAIFLLKIGGHFASLHHPEFPALQATMAFVNLHMVWLPFIHAIEGHPFGYQVMDFPMIAFD